MRVAPVGAAPEEDAEMSRAFVKDDADNERVIVPGRAPLPEGTPNLVTPRGLALLEREREALLEERLRLQGEGDASPDRTRRLTVLGERLDDLEARLASARPVADPPERDDEVGFGADVTTRAGDGEELRFRIVGVDEADPLEGLVAFTAPTAAAVLGRRVGERVTVDAGRGRRELDIVAVAYPDSEAAAARADQRGGEGDAAGAAVRTAAADGTA